MIGPRVYINSSGGGGGERRSFGAREVQRS